MADEATPEPVWTLDWEKLTAPVPKEDIEWVQKTREGQKFAYMTAQFLRRRLDSVAQGRWSYTCEHIPLVADTPLAGDGEPFVVRGRISITVTQSNHWDSIERESIGSGKNFKEAETDAFKRAAQRLGIGNELYEMDALPAGAPPRANPPTGQRVAAATNAVDKPATQAVATPLETVHAECPTCAGPMYDNRLDKKNPNSPDFKCKKPRGSCDGVYWKLKDVPLHMRPDAPEHQQTFAETLDKQKDDLPF